MLQGNRFKILYTNTFILPSKQERNILLCTQCLKFALKSCILILAIFTNFCYIKIDLSGNTV